MAKFINLHSCRFALRKEMPKPRPNFNSSAVLTVASLWLQKLSISSQALSTYFFLHLEQQQLSHLFIFRSWTAAKMLELRWSLANLFLPYLLLLLLILNLVSADLENVEETGNKRGGSNVLLSRYGRALLSRYGKRSVDPVNPPPFIGDYRLTTDIREGKFLPKLLSNLLLKILKTVFSYLKKTGSWFVRLKLNTFLFN